jgi:type VI secretion system protein ImpH
MSTKSGLQSSYIAEPRSITQALLKHVHQFGFFQAVRLLERASIYAKQQGPRLGAEIATKPVALFTPPYTETVRFKSYQTLKFPASEIKAIEAFKNAAGNEQWVMLVNFMGLSGAMGVLPYHYTETLLQRLKLKDESMMHFFDLFNHRTVSLFYQAGTKYNLPLEFERKRLNPPAGEEHDAASQALLSLTGFGTKYLLHRLHNPSESLIGFSGLFNQQIRTANGLQLILQHQFGIPAQIKEFVGQWQQLIDDVRTRLPTKSNPKGQNACLGRTVMLGQNGWFAQGKIRIILGPLNEEQLRRFAPGTNALKSLNELVKLYVGMEIDYDYIIRVKRSDIPDRIKLSSKNPLIIGWNTWLSNKPRPLTANEDTLDIVVTANRLH